MIRSFASLALLLTGTCLTTAQAVTQQDADAFILAPGFERLDFQTLEDELFGLWLDIDKITPGGAVGPVEKAMWIADRAIPSVRTRTAIAYGEMIHDDNGAPLPISFIEVRHYNLGPAIRAQVAADYGEENTAPVEEFGTGEHMAWRFIFQPLMNNSAVLIDASNRVISHKEAAKSDCTGRPCLDLYSGFDASEWEDVAGQVPSWPRLYSDQSDEVATPAHAIAELAVFGFWANAESGQYQWSGGEHPEGAQGFEPYRFIGIDRHLGQEASIDAIWRETKLNDDELFAITFRRAEVAGSVYLMRSSETYPGRP